MFRKKNDDDICGGGHWESDMNGSGACAQAALAARYKHEAGAHRRTTLARPNVLTGLGDTHRTSDTQHFVTCDQVP